MRTRPLRPRIVVVDVETTSLDPHEGRLIDLGAVRLGEDLGIETRFASLVDPAEPIPLAVSRLTGLTAEELREAPGEAEALGALHGFVADSIVVAHNAAFDRAHLEAGAARAGLPRLANEWLDTLEAAQLLFPEFDSHALAALATQLDIECRFHRALPDAEATAVVFARLCARAGALGAHERRLITAAGWPSLAVLDACTPPPERATQPAGAPDESPDGELPRLDVDAGGWLAELRPGEKDEAPRLASRLSNYRPREGQIQLASAVAGLFARGGIGLLEAGTGSGKSLAYLLPAAFHSAAHGSRVVVSTRTKALQRQLAAHELPLVAASLPEEWRWAVLMGRENYLCRRRLEDAAAEAGETLDGERCLALAYLIGRARRTDVDLSALPYGVTRRLTSLPRLARELRSSRTTCTGRHCAHRRSCFWRQARERAEEAHLVCVNHALLLTGLDGLPAFADVVIDEAHLLYQEATEAFSARVDAAVVRRVLADLRPAGHRSLAARLRAAARGAEVVPASALAGAADACERFLQEAPALSARVGQAVAELAEGGREAEEHHGAQSASPYDQSIWLTPGMQELPAWDVFAEAAALLAAAFATLAASFGGASEALPDTHREHDALAVLAEECGMLAALLDELPRSQASDHVVWAEIAADRTTAGAGPNAEREWALVRAPLTPGVRTREVLWERLRTAVLTSATLTVADSFTYFREMTGLAHDLDVVEQVFPSPFDFRRQSALVLQQDDHAAQAQGGAVIRLGERVRELIQTTGGRMLVLFTNKRDMHAVAGMVGDHAEADGVLVLAQGLHGSASSLADVFREPGDTVLFGVDTLWTGQDFPGDALTCLVIARLPFPRQDALFQARRAACDEAGERWFEQFYLPEAVLRFRQGFGRLIRTETDRGVVVVLDPRLTCKPYRRVFLGSLPDVEVLQVASPEIASVVGERLSALSAGGC